MIQDEGGDQREKTGFLMADEDVQVTDGKVGHIQTNPFTPGCTHVPCICQRAVPPVWTLSCTRVLHCVLFTSSGQWSAHDKVFKRVCVRACFVYKCVFVFHPSPAWCGLATDALRGWPNGQERGRGGGRGGAAVIC